MGRRGPCCWKFWDIRRLEAYCSKQNGVFNNFIISSSYKNGVWQIRLPVYSQKFEYKYVICSKQIDLSHSQSSSDESLDSSSDSDIQNSFTILSWEPCENRKYNGSHYVRDSWGVL